MSRLADETPQEAFDRAQYERRELEKRLRAIVNGQRGRARMMRDKALLATLGGWDPTPFLRLADRCEAQAHQTASELVRLRDTSRK